MWLEQEFQKDRYLAAHTRYYIRQMRIIAYTQLLESYRSLSLSHMAATFGVSVEFIDRSVVIVMALPQVLMCAIP